MTLRLAALTLLAAALSPAQPKFVVDGGKLFDFGELYTTSPVVRELRITNSGGDTLRITNVSGSCGCTGTLLSASDIPPGGSGTLKITFDPAKFRGKVEKVVSMNTNDPADSNPHITFTATVTQILDLDQTHLVFSTKPDSEATTVVSIRNVSDGPVRITGTRSSSPELVVELSGGVLQPGGQASLRCRIRPTKPGILRGDVTLSTDHPLLPSVGLRFFSYAKP
ncbi:MAG TPA: DUF1573 domain-containing protein [Bacteroidota bacterium]|nr:DUF1573 domain-containing protein [Bacteroidota bacterium]